VIQQLLGRAVDVGYLFVARMYEIGTKEGQNNGKENRENGGCGCHTTEERTVEILLEIRSDEKRAWDME
jgi:hypothetical protein